MPALSATPIWRTSPSFADTEVLAIGDIVPEAAQEKAAKYDVPAAGDVATVLDHPGVEIVVNLTIPAAHAEVASQAIAAGKHVWNEKPLSPRSRQRPKPARRRRGGWAAGWLRPGHLSWVRGCRRRAGLSSRA